MLTLDKDKGIVEAEKCEPLEWHQELLDTKWHTNFFANEFKLICFS